jgi:hypothetical protein
VLLVRSEPAALDVLGEDLAEDRSALFLLITNSSSLIFGIFVP